MMAFHGFYMAGPDYKSFYEDCGSLGSSNSIWDFYKKLFSVWKLLEAASALVHTVPLPPREIFSEKTNLLLQL